MVHNRITLLSAYLSVIEKHSLDQWYRYNFFSGTGFVEWPILTFITYTLEIFVDLFFLIFKFSSKTELKIE